MQSSPYQNWHIIGLPDDEGIGNTGGRKGAAKGPAAFRKQFSKLKGQENIPDYLEDIGNIEISGDIAERHQRAVDTIVEQHQKEAGSIIIGGGHDYGFPHLKAVHKFVNNNDGKTIGCINIDSHFDVRTPEPAIKSGSPFYMALENGVIQPQHLVEFGIQRHSNGAELWDYVSEKGVDCVPFDDIRLGRSIDRFESKLVHLATHCDAIVISLDLDGMAAAFAPGVSAPQAEGFNSSEVLEMMRLAGQQNKVISLGIYELSPPFDIDNRTARMAATAAYHFLAQAVNRA